jgi:hypothetical protein
MQIYLAQPGGQKQGPYTLDQVRQDLANGKYRDSDFWAYHEGLPNWIPLHSLPGVHQPAAVVKATEAAAARTETATAAASNKIQSPAAQTPAVASSSSTSNDPASRTALDAASESDEETVAPESSVPPYHALEQLFVFTSGEPRPAFESKVLMNTLQELTGQPARTIQHEVASHVIGRTDIGALAHRDQAIPAKAWRAVTAIDPAVAGEAKEGAFEVCLRTCQLENRDVVALLLFYNKNKLAMATA